LIAVHLDSDVSESPVVVAEECLELAEVVAGGGHVQVVPVELENGPEREWEYVYSFIRNRLA
jgi:hypothetical protein